MNVKEINESIDVIDTAFREKYNNSLEYERLLTRAVKLNEEVGELCEAILYENGEQRSDKKDIDLGSEIADVIICALMVGKTKNIDVFSEVVKNLKNRVKIIKF